MDGMEASSGVGDVGGLDVFDIVAVMLGIFFTVRKLDAQSRKPEEFAHVERAAFLDWQRREVGVYTLAVWACFLKVILEFVFLQFVAPGMPIRPVRIVGATIDLSWLAIVLATLWRSSRVRALRRRLGIVLGGFVVQERAGAERPDDEDP